MIEVILDASQIEVFEVILLNTHLKAYVDLQDATKVQNYNWTGQPKGNQWYAMTHIGTKTIWMHQLNQVKI